jgi:hypothetical protein
MPLVASPIVNLKNSFGMTKCMRFNTIAQTTAAAQGSVYVAAQTYPIYDWTMSVPLLIGRWDDPTSEIAQFNGLFGICRGRAGTFLFSDPQDNTVTNSTFGIGDGTSQTFQLTRPIGAFTDIVQNVDGVPAIFVNGTATSLYTISDKGQITFNTAPPAAAVLSWSGQFLWLLRFKADSIQDMSLFFTNSWQISEIGLESVIR